MASLFDDKTVLSIIDGYYSHLEKAGYVKHGTVIRMIMYEFLTEFVNNTYFFITEEDYSMIDSLMKKLFTNGGCLMPYPVLCANRVNIAGYGADGVVRITENDYNHNGLSGNIARTTEGYTEVRIA